MWSCSGTVSVEPIANASPSAIAAAQERSERGFAVAVDADLEDLVAELVEQPARRVEPDDPALVHDRDPIAQPARLLEVMRREQDRHLEPIAEPADQVEQLVADARVEADRRLVQEQHLRP